MVCLTVSLDDPKEEGKLPRVEKFLKSRNATFTNLVLDEEQETWQKKFHLLAPPSVFVFNREGKWKQFKNEGKIEFHYTDVEKTVLEFLKKQ